LGHPAYIKNTVVTGHRYRRPQLCPRLRGQFPSLNLATCWFLKCPDTAE
jgi:hypothetical protein